MNDQIKEKYISWKPFSNLSSKYQIDSIIDTMTSLEIILCEEANIPSLAIIFQVSSGSYQITKEGYYFNRIEELSLVSKEGAFFIVKNSQYLKLLSDQSDTISKTRDFIHFAILLPSYRLDIMAPTKPTIQIIKK